MPQLLIEIPAPAGNAIGFACAIAIVAQSFRLVWPILNDKAARRVEQMRGHRGARKKRG